MSAACRAVRATSRSACTAIVGDNASRDILLTDIFTAFGQRLAGEDIALQPVTHVVGRVVAALRRAGHPSGGRGEPRLLAGDRHQSGPALIGSEVAGTAGVADLARLSSSLTVAETTEIDDARRRLPACRSRKSCWPR